MGMAFVAVPKLAQRSCTGHPQVIQPRSLALSLDESRSPSRGREAPAAAGLIMPIVRAGAEIAAAADGRARPAEAQALREIRQALGLGG